MVSLQRQAKLLTCASILHLISTKTHPSTLWKSLKQARRNDQMDCGTFLVPHHKSFANVLDDYFVSVSSKASPQDSACLDLFYLLYFRLCPKSLSNHSCMVHTNHTVMQHLLTISPSSSCLQQTVRKMHKQATELTCIPTILSECSLFNLVFILSTQHKHFSFTALTPGTRSLDRNNSLMLFSLTSPKPLILSTMTSSLNSLILACRPLPFLGFGLIFLTDLR